MNKIKMNNGGKSNIQKYSSYSRNVSQYFLIKVPIMIKKKF
jgi:hypothetical protein